MQSMNLTAQEKSLLSQMEHTPIKASSDLQYRVETVRNASSATEKPTRGCNGGWGN